jgi:ABC-type uncharacterized transport system involved in gliding motility auxiliary subunit
MKSKTMTHPLTAATFAARGPSLWTRKDPEKSIYQQAAELAWEDGSQPAHRGPEMPGKGLSNRREYDTQAMLEMHLSGSTWREIGRRFDCCGNTAQKATEAAFPHRVKRRRQEPKPASHIVLRTRADAEKTARIQGTGVTA